MSAPAIEFIGVSRWYGDTVSLADVSFTAEAGVVGCSATTVPASRPR